MQFDLDPRLWAAVLILLGVLSFVLARRFTERTGGAPGGTSATAWGLLGALLPFVGLLFLIEATARDEDADAQAPTPEVLASPTLAANVLPA
jgi:hypothetical protein